MERMPLGVHDPEASPDRGIKRQISRRTWPSPERAPHDGNHQASSQSDATHAALAAAGNNFQPLLKWQSLLGALILTVLANVTSLASSRQGT
jgi:hypothetical protein